MDRHPHSRNPGIVLLIALVVLTVPVLAGCVGGGAGPSDADPAEGNESNGTELPPGVESEADLRPHVHDRWIDPMSGDALTEIVLVDQTFTIESYSQDNPALVESCEESRGGPQDTRACFGWVQFVPATWSNGDAKVVPPATARVEVDVSFDAGDFAGIDFWYQHADSGGVWESRITNESNGGAFGPDGDPKFIEPVTLQMADDGHAQVSSWLFGMSPVGDPVTGDETGVVDFGSGEVHVTITAHRAEGPLPLEPPHPLFWDADSPATDTYLIGQLEGSTDGFVQVNTLTWEPGSGGTPKLGGSGLVWQVPVGFEGRRDADRANYPPKLTGDFTAALVPPGSQLIAVEVEVSGAAADGQDPMLCVLGQDVPGKGFPGGQDRDDKLIGDCVTFQDGTHSFQKPITTREADSYYVNETVGISQSRWTFYVQVIAPSVPGDQRGASSFSGSVTAHFFVTDQTSFTVPEWANLGGA